MFVVKRLGKNGMWSAVSLIDQNGSFRGEAKFETHEAAEEYMTEYLKRMKSRQRVSPEGYGDVKVFDDDKSVEISNKGESAKVKSKPKGKIYDKRKKKTHDHQSQF